MLFTQEEANPSERICLALGAMLGKMPKQVFEKLLGDIFGSQESFCSTL